MLAGRRDVIDAMGESLDVAALDGRTPRPLLLGGGRGVGKTVLLARARLIAAERHSWISADVEVHPERPFTPALVARLREVAGTYDQSPPARGGWSVDQATVKASIAGVGRAVQTSRDSSTSAPPEMATEEALRTAMTAVALLAEASGGDAYAIQVFGHHAWRASHGATHIDVEAARAGLAAGQRDLAAGSCTSRWNDAPPREQEQLTSLADLGLQGHHPSGSDVARALGREASAVSYLRARSLREGTIYADGRWIRFAVPGTASWIAEHALED